MSPAYDIKPKTPESASPPSCARTFWASPRTPRPNPPAPSSIRSFKGRTDTKTDIQQQKFGNTAISYHLGADVQLPRRPKSDRRSAVGSFSSPASGNRAYFIARNLTFAKDQQPAKADMVKEVMGKYGAPTIVGDQHLYYIYRGGSIVSVGAKYKEATAH